MTPTTIEEFESLNYRITLHQNDNGYLLHLPELHLFAEDSQIEAAYDKLMTAKIGVLKNYFEAEKSSKIPLPSEQAEMTQLKKSLMPFAIKLGAFALVGVFLISAANISLTYSLQQAPKAIAQKAARAALQNFGQTLEKVARKEFTPEKEQRIRLGIRKLVAALKPFVNEFEPLYRKVE
jgi:hypothetical protein